MPMKLVPTVLIAAAIAAGAAPAAQGPEPGRRWALVVTGDSEGPRNEGARAIAQTLRRQYGYGEESIQELPGASLSALYSSLNTLGARINRADSLVVYLAARTLSLSRGKTIGEQIVLADGNEREPWTLLGLSELLARVQAVGAGATLLMLDDCLQVDSGYGSQRPSSMSQQSKAAFPVRNPIQVLAGCPPDAFGSAAAAALAAAAAPSEPRRFNPRDLAARMTLNRKDLRAAATGEGAFIFEPVNAPAAALTRFDRTNDAADRQRAINELVRTTLSDKAAANVTEANAAFLKVALDRKDDPRVRIAAVRGIGLIGAPTGERDIAAVIRDESDTGVVSAGISALERLRTPAAISELQQMVDATGPLARAGSIRALGRIESRDSLPRIVTRLAAERESEPIIAALEVVPVLANSANAPAVSTVLELLRRPGLSASVEVAAVGALGLLRTARAEQVLIARLAADKPEAVRAAAAVALSSLDLAQGSAREQALIKALRDSAYAVQESAAFALGRLKATGATRSLVSLLVAAQGDPRVRAAAASALGDIAAADARDALVGALADQSSTVRRAAAAALGKIGDRSALQRLRELQENDKDPYVRTAATNAIGVLSNASELIDEDLRSTDPLRRRSAISRVARSGRPDAVGVIINLLADPDPQVVAAAITELARMTSANLTETLIGELRRSDPSREGSSRRRGAALALGARGSQPVIDALLAHAGDADMNVRAGVLSALTNFEDQRVMDALRAAEGAPNPALRQAAADALTAYGNTLYAKERPADAIAAFEAALRIHTELFGTNDPQVAVDLNNLGVALQRLGRSGEAEERLRAALRIREEVLGPADAETATSLVNLGLVYSSQKNFGRAEPLYLRALTIREATFGPEDAQLMPLLDQLSQMYVAQGRHEEALRLSKRALAIRSYVASKHP